MGATSKGLAASVSSTANSDAKRKRIFVRKNFDGSRHGGRVRPVKAVDVPECSYNAPSIYSLSQRDLFDFVRLEAIYVQAVEEGIIQHSTEMSLNWVAAALLARLDPESPLKSFSSLVTGQYWSLISDEYYAWAKSLLAHHRRRNPALFDL